MQVRKIALAILIGLFGTFDPRIAAGAPNVLLIMTDDQGFGDVRSHGNPHIDTPVHDRIAAEGVRFDRFYVSPVCAPTRASLLTGRWHLRTGVHGVTRAKETMRADETTVAELLQNSGYVTGAFGKWHNGAHFPHHPNGQGFEQFVGFCAGHWNNYFDGRFERNGTRERFDGFIIDRLTDEAIRFIQSNSNRPWFCYVPYNTPHSPWQVPDEYWAKYANTSLSDKEKCAYAMVENIDHNMGRLLKTLEASGVDENTIVIFLTDNGANSERFNAGMKGRKGSLHEGGSRVPCFIRWPTEIPAERTIPQIAAHIDLLPTIAELVGIDLPQDLQLDGRSLVPLLEGRTASWPARHLFTHWGDDRDDLPSKNRGAVRSDRWRAVKYNGAWELYDMLADPSQLNDVSKRYPDELLDLSNRYEQWFSDVTANGFSPIRTEIGHSERDQITLPGHEAFLEFNDAKQPGISYVGRAGWANDWVTNWTSKDSHAKWLIEVVRPGRYKIALECSANGSVLGSNIEVRVGGKAVARTISEELVARTLHSPDRIDRGEVYEREWPVFPIGEFELPSGQMDLTVHATEEIQGATFIELKSVQLTRIE